MATAAHDQVVNPSGISPAGHATRVEGLPLDWTMAILSTVFLGGLYLDGWAHNHGKVDQSFFTPWHAFFYAGYLLTAVGLLAAVFINWRRGLSWRAAIPVGYGLSIVGLAIFAVGGVGDLIWHTLFGIEEDFEALVSPTHLMLGAGLALVVSGPLRAAWHRPGGRGWRQLAPAMLSLTLLISTFTFFMMFSHPLMSIIAGARHGHFNGQVGQIAGVISLLVTTALLLGPLLVALRRWRLPAGALTLVWGLNAVGMAILDWGLPYAGVLLGALVAAVVVCDWLLARAQAALPDLLGLRVFTFVAPALLFGAYFLALLGTEGSRWSIHLLGGAVVLAGVAGWLLSYLAWPPALPDELA